MQYLLDLIHAAWYLRFWLLAIGLVLFAVWEFRHPLDWRQRTMCDCGSTYDENGRTVHYADCIMVRGLDHTA